MRGVRFHAENIENIIPKPELPPPQKPPRLKEGLNTRVSYLTAYYVPYTCLGCPM